ncbi:hypothetical protein ACW9I6_02600 [Pseudomonas sp. SDO5522_S412]
MKTQQIIARIVIALLVLAALITPVMAPWIIEKTSPEIGIYTGAMSGYLIFILLLDVKTMRFPKGMLLIGYGVLFQVLYTKWYFFIVDPKTPNIEDLKVQLDLYMQVLLFACAGAGGSIIANYADKSSSDYDKALPSSNIIDNTKHIDALRDNIIAFGRKIDLALAISSASLLIASITAVVLLFK